MMLEQNPQRNSRPFNFSFSRRSQTARTSLALSTAVAASMLAMASAHADVFGNNGGTDLSQASSWTDQTTPGNLAVPGANDIARWDSLSAGGTFTLGVATNWQGIVVANPTAAVTIGTTADITAGGALTLGTSGIDLTTATQNLSIVDNLTLGGTQTWNVSTGRTLTQSGTLNNNGQALTFAGAGGIAVSGVISGSGSVTMSGTGTVTLSKTNTYSGGTTINSGTLAITVPGGAGNAAADTVTLSGGTLSVAGAGSSAMPNNFVASASTSSTITGTGTQEFSGNVTGSGTINLSFGSGATFDITNTNMFSAFTGTLEMGSSVGAIRYGGSSAGGTLTHTSLDLGTSTASFNDRLGGSIGIGSLAGGSGTNLTGSTSAADATTYSIGGAGLSTVFAGAITTGSYSSSATTAVTITGGTLTLTGTNSTYTGVTTISAGTLQIGNGGTTSGRIGTGSVTNNSVLAFDPGSSITFSNAISGSGAVNHFGPGTSTLSGNNSYTGGTNITAGTLVANNTTSALGTGPVSITGGTLAGVGTVTAAVTVGPGGGQITPGNSGVGTLTLNSLTLNTGSAINTDFVAAGPTNLINIATANGLTVNGGGINLYTTGNNPLTTNGTYDIFQFPSPYTATVPANLLTVLNPPSSGSPVYTWGTSGNDITLTVSGLASASAWQNNTGGSWTVAGNWSAGIPNGVGATANFGSNPGITAPGTINLDGNKTVGNIIFNNTVGAGSTSYTIAAGSGGSLTIDNGTGLAGITDLNGSHLISAPVVFNSNTLLSVTNSTDTLAVSGAITGNGGLTVGGAGTVVLTGSNAYLGSTNISSGTLQIGTGSTGSIPAGAIINNGTLVYNVTSGTTLPNAISGTGNLVQAGPGSLIYTGGGTYTGATNVSSGTLQIGAGGTIGTGPLIVAGGASLDLNGVSVTATTLSGGGLIDDVAGAGTPTITVGNSSSTTFSGSIRNTTGTVGLVKTGAGTLTLSGSNSYTGTTNVSAGTLVLAGGGVITGSTLIGQGFQVSGGSLTSTTATNLNAAANDFSETAGTVSLAALTATNSDATLFNLSGGVFTATSINIPRSAAFATAPTAAAPLAGATNSGLYVHGTANASVGTLAIGTGNSSASIRIDNGSLTATGEVEVGAIINGSTRWSILQVNGGTFTSTDATNGIVLSQNQLNASTGGTTNADDAELYISAGTATAQKIQFGLATDTTGGKGFLIVGGGTLYLGSGGIVQSNTNGYSSTIDLNGGTIGAIANWSSPVPMNLTGISTFTFETADASGNAFNITLTGALSGTGSLTKTGAGVLTLSGVGGGYSGDTNVNAGTLTIGPTANIASNNVTVAAGATLNANGNSYAGLSNNTNLTSNGTTTFGGNLGTGSPAPVLLSSLVIGSTGNVLLNDPGAGNHGNRTILVTGSLNLGGGTGAWQGKLDLAGNDMIVHGGNLADLTNQVVQGFNGGAWNGSAGITSSTAATDPKRLTAIGVIQNDNGTNTGTALVGSFDGQGVSDSDILLKYTYYGDTNLDGIVDGTDYSRIDAAYLANKTAPGSATGWFNGDFNYDGVINGSDYTLIDNAYNMQGASLAAEIAGPAAVATAQVAGSSSSASVPEPASVGLLVMGAAGLLGRRKRRK